MPTRRFPPTWSVEEHNDACFIVCDRNGQKLAYVYFEDEPGRRSAAKLLTRDEARRIAVNFAKLPDLVGKPIEARMKRPIESDFEINVTGGGVEVIFKPTKSHYSYNRLVDPKDIARFGPISPARVRHAGATGDTGDYSSHDVEAMALRLAADAVK